MKRIRFLSLIISALLLINGCSQTSSNIPQGSVDHRASVSSPSQSNIPRVSQQLPSQRYNPQQSSVYNMSSARMRMVNIAKSVIGVPYKWGGNSPREGFDCSGFTKFVHKKALGITIPRVTAQQRDKSKTIRYAQLQAGDMLFFKTGKRNNHVGIYIGNRQFVHAPSGGKRVHISSMDSSYWHSRFVKFGSFL